jgi:hypothetical protein
LKVSLYFISKYIKKLKRPKEHGYGKKKKINGKE